MEKIQIDVETEEPPGGIPIPKSLRWADGRHFKIARVLYYSASPTGEYEGIRYTIIIGSAEKYIYRINHKWYVMV